MRRRWVAPYAPGVFWSPAAVALGAALPLLAYAYEYLQPDRSIRINLHRASEDLGVPYPTVKRWWAQLLDSPFLERSTARGRAGAHAKMRPEWIEWAPLPPVEETGSETIPITPDPETGSNMIPIVEETGSETIPITAAAGGNSSETAQKRDGNGIIFDPPIHESHIDMIHESGIESIPLPPAQKPKRKYTRRAVVEQVELLETAVGIYTRSTGRRPNQVQRDAITAAIEDLARWRETVESFQLNGWNTRAVENLIDNYRKRVAHAKGQSQTVVPPTDRPHGGSISGDSERGQIRAAAIDW